MRSTGTALILLMMFVLPVSAAGGDEVAALVTDRPDFTESAETVPRGGYQLEFGYTFGQEGDEKTHTLGEVLLRAALGSRAELRVGLNSWAWADSADCRCDGLEDSYLGAKIKLADGPDEPGGIRPGMAVLVGTSLPTGSDAFTANDLQPDVKLALAWELTDRTGLSSNIGYARVSKDGVGLDELSGSLSLGYGLTASVGCYLEYFQFLHTDDGVGNPGYLNGGITWLTREHFQLDWRAGYQIAGGGSEFFTGIGATWRWFRRR